MYRNVRVVYFVQRLHFTSYEIVTGVPQRHKKGHICGGIRWPKYLSANGLGADGNQQDGHKEQLALQISCSTSALKKIEAEERRPSAQIVERLADIFNIPQEERKAFLRFARGDWQAISDSGHEDSPWLISSARVTKEVETAAPIQNLPSGTVTFLFTDIEGSSRLAQAHPKEWETLLERHHVILRESIESNNGYVFQVVGDGFCAAFHTPNDGLHAAVKAQTKVANRKLGCCSY